MCRIIIVQALHGKEGLFQRRILVQLRIEQRMDHGRDRNPVNQMKLHGGGFLSCQYSLLRLFSSSRVLTLSEAQYSEMTFHFKIYQLRINISLCKDYVLICKFNMVKHS
jgi:hypothetical protein